MVVGGSVSLAIPGSCMRRADWRLLTLAAVGGAVAWGYRTSEITGACRTLPPTQPQDVLFSIEKPPNLMTGIAIAGAASPLSMLDVGMAALRNLNAGSDRLRAEPWASLSGTRHLQRLRRSEPADREVGEPRK